MLSTVPLSLPILAADVSITNSNLVGDRRKKVRCAVCGMGVSRINARDHWTVAAERGLGEVMVQVRDPDPS